MTAKRIPRTAWKVGASGNPAGRPPGSGEVARLRSAIAERLPELLAAILTRALEGDMQAARLLLERVIAPLKPSEPPAPMELPNGSLSDQGRAILIAVASGTLAPGQGAALLGAVGTLARVMEFDELARRVTALEVTHGNAAIKANLKA